MKTNVFLAVTVLSLTAVSSHAAAEDKTSFGVEIVSKKDRTPFQESSNPNTYKYLSSNNYIEAGPKVTLTRSLLFFEASAQTLLSTPRMENVAYTSDKMEIDSSYSATALVGVVVHESFIPYVGLGYSQTKSTYKGNFTSSTTVSFDDDSKTTSIGLGIRSVIPITKMVSVYGDGSYRWTDTKSDTTGVIRNTFTGSSSSGTDSSSSHDGGFTIDVGLTVTPVPNITVRALVGISRTKTGDEPESESTAYTLGLFYNF